MLNENNYTNSLEQSEIWFSSLSKEERSQVMDDINEGNIDLKISDRERSDIRFINAMNSYGDRKSLHQTIQDIYANDNTLVYDTNNVDEPKGKVVNLFSKYKRITAIAACIAGLTALVITVVTLYVSPAKNQTEIQQLSREVEKIKKAQAYQSSKIMEVESKVPKGAVVKSGGSAFLIDGKGYFITNAHVLNGSGAVVVNTKGQEFKTDIVFIDQTRDLAIIKIKDKDFRPIKYLPYGFKKSKLELGQDIFTLGYPRNDIVYNTGYVSSATGYDGDTSSIQVAMVANPGNSGGPLFNKNGEIVGVLSTRETKAEGVSFAIKTNEIFQTLDDWKKTDTSSLDVHSSNSKTLARMSRTEQIKELESYIYLVKVY
ncbi:MAG: serine protease [Pseudopedobacter saltans]|uniref:Serine protease n=1 Tax=Pseudopedobacter saltans TaxID=151895 RepID=A0A2W5EYI1_9SPHI|nr:MAG: serine protease [Pseudopedobacter saltans]